MHAEVISGTGVGMGVEPSERGTGPSGAIFLSYASEDAAAALRICESLRAAGAEVWFDQSELRGGDAWDAAIRGHIKACALFIPIVSANTQARAEGYFRLEWKLAVDRSHLISADKAFLLPVSIDATPESSSRVPERFRDVQWTHLPGGVPTPEFAARVMSLLGRASGAAPSGASTPRATSPAPTAPRAGSPAPVSRRHGALIAAGVAVLALAALGAYFGLMRRGPAPLPAAAGGLASEPALAANERSIAVLPFTDMSAGKNQEYFADGLAEELIDVLARETDMRVAARTSSFYFKGKQVMIADVAKALGVQNVLEGSVRVSGNTMRVTAQLIRADGGFHLWSAHYDRNLSDVFQVQDDIASSVVQALKATLHAGGERGAISAADSRAHDRILQARYLAARMTDRDMSEAIALLDAAIRDDPGYPLAWAARGAVHRLRAVFIDDTPDAGIALARADARHALELNPQLSEAHVVLGEVAGTYDLNYPAAKREYEAAGLPRERRIFADSVWSGCVRDTCYAEVMRVQDAVVRDDPLNPVRFMNRGLTRYLHGDYRAAEQDARHSLELSSGNSANRYLLVRILLAEHETAGAQAVLGTDSTGIYGRAGRALVAQALGDRVAAQAALEDLIKRDSAGGAYQIAEVYAARGDREAALSWLERAYRQHDGGLWTMHVDPLFSGLAKEPRFIALRQRMNPDA